MADSGVISSIRSVGNIGGGLFLALAGAAVTMTVALALVVLAVGGSMAAVTAATGIGMMEAAAEGEYDPEVGTSAKTPAPEQTTHPPSL